MYSDSEMSSSSDTSSSNDEEVFEEEEDGDEFIFSHITPYKDETLAVGDAGDDDEEDQANVDGLTPTVLDARYEREVPVKFMVRITTVVFFFLS